MGGYVPLIGDCEGGNFIMMDQILLALAESEFLFSALLGAVMGPVSYRLKLLYPVLALTIGVSLFNLFLALWWNAEREYDVTQIVISALILNSVILMNYFVMYVIGFFTRMKSQENGFR